MKTSQRLVLIAVVLLFASLAACQAEAQDQSASEPQKITVQL